MYCTGKITSKGQTTIPKEVRDRLKLFPGDQLSYSLEDGRIVLRARNRSAMEFAGILHRPGEKAVTTEEMDDAIVAAIVERDDRSRQ